MLSNSTQLLAALPHRGKIPGLQIRSREEQEIFGRGIAVQKEMGVLRIRGQNHAPEVKRRQAEVDIIVVSRLNPLILRAVLVRTQQ